MYPSSSSWDLSPRMSCPRLIRHLSITDPQLRINANPAAAGKSATVPMTKEVARMLWASSPNERPKDSTKMTPIRKAPTQMVMKRRYCVRVVMAIPPHSESDQDCTHVAFDECYSVPTLSPSTPTHSPDISLRVLRPHRPAPCDHSSSCIGLFPS